MEIMLVLPKQNGHNQTKFYLETIVSKECVPDNNAAAEHKITFSAVKIAKTVNPRPMFEHVRIYLDIYRGSAIRCSSYIFSLQTRVINHYSRRKI